MEKIISVTIYSFLNPFNQQTRSAANLAALSHSLEVYPCEPPSLKNFRNP